MKHVLARAVAVALLAAFTSGCTTSPQFASAEEIKGQHPHVTRVKFAF